MCKLRFNTITNIPHRVNYSDSTKKQKILYVSNKSQNILLDSENFNSFIENAQRLVAEEYAILLRSL